jgi:2-haloacid dehalogenase
MTISGDVKLLTFDCYGTLIDWETGILAALRPILGGRNLQVSDHDILELYASVEATIELGDYRPYREVLRSVVKQFGERYGFHATEDEMASLAESLQDWPPFTDAEPALRKLQEKHQLAVISNVDDDLFAASINRLGIDFNHIITAQQANAYKPSEAVFEFALRSIDIPRERILHCAQSLYHDIAPARKLGIGTVWINRRHRARGFGATPPSEARPDFEVPDLLLLAKLLEA